jgi:hypothetical protein
MLQSTVWVYFRKTERSKSFAFNAVKVRNRRNSGRRVPRRARAERSPKEGGKDSRTGESLRLETTSVKADMSEIGHTVPLPYRNPQAHQDKSEGMLCGSGAGVFRQPPWKPLEHRSPACAYRAPTLTTNQGSCPDFSVFRLPSSNALVLTFIRRMQW